MAKTNNLRAVPAPMAVAAGDAALKARDVAAQVLEKVGEIHEATVED